MLEAQILSPSTLLLILAAAKPLVAASLSFPPVPEKKTETTAVNIIDAAQ